MAAWAFARLGADEVGYTVDAASVRLGWVISGVL